MLIALAIVMIHLPESGEEKFILFFFFFFVTVTIQSRRHDTAYALVFILFFLQLWSPLVSYHRPFKNALCKGEAMQTRHSLREDSIFLFV